MFDEHPGLAGIFIATDNCAGTCRYVREHGLTGKAKIVATGIFPGVRKELEAGVVQFSLFQRMHEQGRLAARSLYEFLAERVQPPDEILVAPLVALRNNIESLAADEAQRCQPCNSSGVNSISRAALARSR
jgi:ABC-type sugar transport system substrate-binding protein